MLNMEAGTAIGEGFICDAVQIAIAKRVEGMDDDDRFGLDQGIEYLNSALEGHKRMLRGPFDGKSVERARRIHDVMTVMFDLVRKGEIELPRTEPELGETIEVKLTSYASVLERLRDNALTSVDTPVIQEEDKVWSGLGWLLLRKADSYRKQVGDCAYGLTF